VCVRESESLVVCSEIEARRRTSNPSVELGGVEPLGSGGGSSSQPNLLSALVSVIADMLPGGASSPSSSAASVADIVARRNRNLLLLAGTIAVLLLIYFMRLPEPDRVSSHTAVYRYPYQNNYHHYTTTSTHYRFMVISDMDKASRGEKAGKPFWQSKARIGDLVRDPTSGTYTVKWLEEARRRDLSLARSFDRPCCINRCLDHLRTDTPKHALSLSLCRAHYRGRMRSRSTMAREAWSSRICVTLIASSTRSTTELAWWSTSWRTAWCLPQF